MAVNSKAIGVAYEDQQIVSGSIDDTPIGATTRNTGAFTTLSSTGTTSLGDAATDTIGFYGATPVVQRAAAIQAASVVSASTWASVASNQAAFFAEVAACLTGLGLWKGAA